MGEIQIVSTENKIELISPLEVSIKAGGSELTVGTKGIFLKTAGKYENKAKEHLFLSGERVYYDIKELPKVGPFAIDFLFLTLAGHAIDKAKVILFDNKDKTVVWEGETNKKGKSAIYEQGKGCIYDALIGFDGWSNIIEDDEIDENDQIDVGDHGIQSENNN